MVTQMKPAYDLVVMGDTNLDWVCPQPLSFPLASLVSNGVIEWMPIEELPGGSGLNFARFASEVGFHPLLLGKVGCDPAGDSLLKFLAAHGLQEGILRSEELSTGKAFIVRDANDIRFLVNNGVNANRSLSAPEVDRFADSISAASILYVSGYCLMHLDAPRTEAALHAMHIARSGACQAVVFDVVPHQVYKRYTFEEFLRNTSEVNILISEAATMRRFLGLGDRAETLTRPIVEETAAALKPYYSNFILRYGPSGCDYEVIWNQAQKTLTWQATGHEHAADKRGFGDRLAIRTLIDQFGLGPKP